MLTNQYWNCVLLLCTVTLFELMVVNNWWIIMEGFYAGSGRRSTRAFFIFFHLTTSVSNVIFWSNTMKHILIKKNLDLEMKMHHKDFERFCLAHLEEHQHHLIFKLYHMVRLRWFLYLFLFFAMNLNNPTTFERILIMLFHLCFYNFCIVESR